jgi:rRNA processing protein Gar1
VNDVVNVLKDVKINLFADDMLLSIACDTIEEANSKINDELSKLNDCLCFNKLCLNCDKTKLITLKKNINKNLFKVKINNNYIENVNEMKYLGVVIDEKLNMIKMVDYIIGKMTKKYFTIKRISTKLNRHAIETLYKSLVLPHIDYCATILFTLSDKQINRIQRIQNKFLRLILRVPWDTSSKIMHDSIGWLTVKQRIVYNTIVFIYKIENENMPNYMKIKLRPREENMQYGLRSNFQYRLPDYTKRICQSSIFYSGMKIYNDLKNKKRFTNKKEFLKICKIYSKEHYYKRKKKKDMPHSITNITIILVNKDYYYYYPNEPDTLGV